MAPLRGGDARCWTGITYAHMAGAEGPRPTQGIHMHIFETFNGFTVLILLLLAGAWLALLAYEGKL